MPLVMDLWIDRAAPGPLRWAVVLAEDAALPHDLEDPGDHALRSVADDGHRDPADVWVQGADGPRWFVRNAGLAAPGVPSRRHPNALGSVLVGEVTAPGPVELSIVGPTRGPLLVDTGPTTATNLPVLGVPTGTSTTRRRSSPRCLLVRPPPTRLLRGPAEAVPPP